MIGGSSSPSQLIKQAGPAAEGTYHILFFLPWFPEAMPDGKLAKAFVDEWNKRGHPFEGLTEGFRGHDGIATITEAVKIAGKDDVQLPGSAPLRPGIESVRFAEDARRMFAAAGQPKQLGLVDSSFHSSDLVTTAPDRVVKETSALIFRFLKANS